MKSIVKEIIFNVLAWVMFVVVCATAIFVVGASATAHTTFEYMDDELDLLAGLIAAEARGESYDGMLAVGTVVMNRVDDGGWGNSIQSVIHAKNQFAKPRDEYSEECLNAAKDVLNGHRSFPENVLYFQVKKVDKWRSADWHCKIGNHNFYSEGILNYE